MPQNTKSPGEGGLSEGRENDPQGNSIVPTPLELVKARLEERGCLFGSGQDWQCPNHDVDAIDPVCERFVTHRFQAPTN